MLIIDKIDQGTDEWFAEKAGVPSASNFNKIITSTGKPSATANAYMHELAAEAVTGRIEIGFKSKAMEAGNAREEESRDLYELIEGVKVTQVGFVYPNKKKPYGCSPDGLIILDGKHGGYGLEMKNPLPKTHVGYLMAGKLPTDYYQQVQGSLLVTGYKRWDFMSYSPGLPPFIISVGRDEKFLKALRAELKKFREGLDKTIKALREMG